ncbi:MAG TPA: DEAD/DEAH box helicase [Actinomycetota bacterium]|jgi:ATP-dependent RNA helicase DeaD/ATP-dependent RNA helicase RhlE|nr:DEAD/DEAH box helicase [Actinomycetota bacterium]
MPRPSFSDLGVSLPVVRALNRRGIISPFPIQSLVLPGLLAGRDILARSQTGSGKTLAFAIPIVERAPRPPQRPAALVLVPTRELAAQVVGEFAGIAEVRGLRVAAAYGGVSIRDQADALSRADVVVATPGRLEDLASRGRIRLDGVRILVLDEADRMLDMGFQPQVDRIVRRLSRDRQTMFFSATLGAAVRQLAAAYTRDAVMHEVEARRPTVEEVQHRFVPVTNGGKIEALAAILEGTPGRGLVFVRTKRSADRLALRLRARGIPAAAMHGDLSQAARERALDRFRSGKVATLVATDVAARGLDVEDVAHVINYDPPEDDDGYVHRVGRTARAGRSGTGITLVLPEQRADVSRIAARLRLADEFRQEGMEVAPPRLVYMSRRGRRSQLYGRPRRSA